MEPLEQILQEIIAFDIQLSRRSFLGAALLVAIAPKLSLGKDDQRIIDAVAAATFPTAPGVNPSWSIMALARHVATGIVTRGQGAYT